MPTESRPVYIGRTTARMLDAEPPAVVGVLVKAILAWALRDELPTDLPADLAGRWAVIEDESKTMHELRGGRADAGRRSGEARRNKREQTANKAEQNGTSAEQTEANGSKAEQTPSNAEQKEKEKEKEKENIIRNESETERAGKPASASASDSASGKIDLSFFDWFTRPDKELVPAALELIGEQGNARMRGRLGKAKRVLGLAAFREELATFAAELRAGEVPANPGATLNARLSAKEACR